MKPTRSDKVKTICIIASVLSSLLSTSANVITNQLIAYYPFNNNSIDESGNGNDGSVSGAIPTTDRFGNANSAYHFDGVNDLIVVADNPMFTVTDVSVAAWIRTTDKSEYKHITSCYGTGWNSEWYNLKITTGTGTARWQTDPGGTSTPPISIGTTDVADGNWHFLVGTRDISTGLLQIYVDGNLEATTADIATESLDPEVDFWIGGQNGFSENFFNGDIDDVRVYNRALTTQEIGILYAIPEPSTAALLGISGVLLFKFRKKLFR